MSEEELINFLREENNILLKNFGEQFELQSEYYRRIYKAIEYIEGTKYENTDMYSNRTKDIKQVLKILKGDK